MYSAARAGAGMPEQAGFDKIDGSFRPVGFKLICGLLIAAVLFIPAAEVLRLVRGWPLNSAWYPGVAGPGDSHYAYYPAELNWIKKLWNGEAEAEIENSAQVGLAKKTVVAEAKHDNWDARMIAARSDTYSIATPWTRIVVPDVAELQGKTLDVKMNLTAIYPAPAGPGKYVDTRVDLEYREKLFLATPGAGALYMRLW